MLTEYPSIFLNEHFLKICLNRISNVTDVNGIVKCFNYNTQECIFTINEKRQTYGLTFHPRLHKFITYGDDLKINFYDYETQVKERTFKRR